MIQRIVLIKFKDDYANEAGRTAAVEHTRRVFSNLPHVREFSVGTPSDKASGAAWDLCIQARFDDMDSVEAYGVQPDHADYVRDYLNPRAAVKKAWNFQI